MSEFLSGNEWYWRLARTVLSPVMAEIGKHVGGADAAEGGGAE